MKPLSRKKTRFFVINPDVDRRNEVRFVSRESVVVRLTESKRVVVATAFDIGQKGLRLEINETLKGGEPVQISFPNSADHVHCFGHIAWIRPGQFMIKGEIGVAIDTWMGIVEGANSWKQFQGFKPKKDRRGKNR